LNGKNYENTNNVSPYHAALSCMGSGFFSHPVFFDRGHCADFDQRFKEQGKMTGFALPFRLSVADEVKAGWFKSNNQASTRSHQPTLSAPLRASAWPASTFVLIADLRFGSRRPQAANEIQCEG
jgi:hypothetical protein